MKVIKDFARNFCSVSGFANVFLKHVHRLLKEQEERKPTSVDWISVQAADASNMKKTETIR